MGGGAYIYEGRVVCESYPSGSLQPIKVPEIKTVAGWGFAGIIQNSDGQEIEFSDPKNRKVYIDSLADQFWTIHEALAYANGEDGGKLAMETYAVRVKWTKTGYKLQRNIANT